MQIEVTSAVGDAVEACETVATALFARCPKAPDFAFVQCQAGLSADAIRQELRRLWPSTSLQGASTHRGTLTSSAVVQDTPGLTVLALWEEGLDAATSCAAVDDGQARQAAQHATVEALQRAGRAGEVPSLAWLCTSPGLEEDALLGMHDVLGDSTPICGGSAADDDLSGGWFLFDADLSCRTGVCVAVLFSSGVVRTSFQTGFVPTPHAGAVTAADGREVVSIDGRPAADVLNTWTDGAFAAAQRQAQEGNVDVAVLQESSMRPLGRRRDGAGHPLYTLSYMSQVTPRGGIRTFTRIDVGEQVALMHGDVDALCRRPAATVQAALETLPASHTPSGAWVVMCGGCRSAVEGRLHDVASATGEVLAGVPFVMSFPFGEQGAIHPPLLDHGNLMVGAVVFATRKDDPVGAADALD